MKKETLFAWAMGFGFVSVLFFMAGSGVFEVMPKRWANFIGMAFVLGSGYCWMMYGRAEAQK